MAWHVLLNMLTFAQNRCGQAYGPAFLLQNERTETDRRAAMAAGPAVWAAESKWDPWFSRKSQLFDHTTYSSGADIRTTRLPSQYGSEPAPGLKTFITSPGGNPNLGTWTTSAPGKARIGSSVLRVTPGPSGKSLRWDSPNAYHNGILKRGEHYSASATVTSTMTSAPIAYPSTQQTFAPTALASVTGKTTSLTPVLAYQVPDFHMRRQAMENGSFLDARVYREAFGCSAPDIDPCLEEDCWDGGSVYETDGIIANFSSVGLTSVSGGCKSLNAQPQDDEGTLTECSVAHIVFDIQLDISYILSTRACDDRSHQCHFIVPRAANIDRD